MVVGILVRLPQPRDVLMVNSVLCSNGSRNFSKAAAINRTTTKPKKSAVMVVGILVRLPLHLGTYVSNEQADSSNGSRNFSKAAA